MKKLISIIAVCAVILSAASCGGTTTENTAANEGTTTTTASASSAGEAPAETAAAEEPAEKVIPEATEYIPENGITERMKALSVEVEGNKARLAKVLKKAQSGEPITVAFLGGSITQGYHATDINREAYAPLTAAWLREKFPDSEITYVNAGIGATGSYIGVYRTDRDVLYSNPDLVFVDFSVNDTTENTDRNIASYDGVIRKLWAAESKPAVITIAMTMENGTTFQQYHEEVCKAYDIPMISYHNAIHDAIDNGYITWQDISPDDIHPNSVGHKALSEMIASYLEGVIAELDTIDTEHESDLSAVYKTDKYASAYLMMPNEAVNAETCGWKSEFFGNFGDAYFAKSKDGSFDGFEDLKFEVEAKSIGIFYGKMISNGGTFDVVVDGEPAKVINSDFKGGWGNYVEAAEVIEFDECGTHTVEIVPHKGEKANITISALALTK